eukprot:TRINITY_DN106899_c0_g1_i1.p1 TRINITY_DN106899_c0_g1~~TRINITY_DN106899_c0_g1_i1.p1  ORF type:complete len:359 (+),score=69.49 TRINITY_DN106899_c0_g1_i1:119-1078(+)
MRGGRYKGILVEDAGKSEQAVLASLVEQQKQMSDTILKAFDKDKSGGLCRIELVPMLKQYSLEVHKEEVQPTEDDIEFLFKLCDHGALEGKSDGIITRDEVLWITDAWGEFIRRKRYIMDLMKRHDFDRSGGISRDELYDILDEVKEKDKLARVPPEVTDWIFTQSDISQTGALSCMELARALCAYDMWVGNRVRTVSQPDRMMSFISDDSSLAGPQRLSDAEWRKRQKQKTQILEMLRRHDLNGDDVLELKEITALFVQVGFPAEQAAVLLASIDRNGDGVVTPEEFLNWVCGTSSDAKRTLQVVAPPSSTPSACTLA